MFLKNKSCYNVVYSTFFLFYLSIFTSHSICMYTWESKNLLTHNNADVQNFAAARVLVKIQHYLGEVRLQGELQLENVLSKVNQSESSLQVCRKI